MLLAKHLLPHLNHHHEQLLGIIPLALGMVHHLQGVHAAEGVRMLLAKDQFAHLHHKHLQSLSLLALALVVVC